MRLKWSNDLLPFAGILLVAALPFSVRVRAPTGAAAMATIVFIQWLGRLATIFQTRDKVDHHRFLLHTIRASHFVEKVRWCLDLQSADYKEEADVGILGLFLQGRSVPCMEVRPPSGSSYMVSGSASCTRALHGALMRDGVDQSSLQFLELSPEMAELEAKIDRLGTNVQQIIYGTSFAASGEDGAIREAWGLYDTTLPLWQRVLGRTIYPLLKGFVGSAFPISKTLKGWEQACSICQELEDRLKGTGAYIMGKGMSYIDVCAAAILYPVVLCTAEELATFAGGVHTAGPVAIKSLEPRQQEFAKRFPLLRKLVLHMFLEKRSKM